MLNEETERYMKLTGKSRDDIRTTPVCVIGSYLDGYDKAIDDMKKKYTKQDEDGNKYLLVWYDDLIKEMGCEL